MRPTLATPERNEPMGGTYAPRAMQAGYVLPLVFAVLLLLSFMALGVISGAGQNASTTRRTLHQRRAFFIADDLCRILGELGGAYFSDGEYLEIDAACEDDLSCDFENYVTSSALGGDHLSRYAPPGYEPTLVVREVQAAEGEATPLPSGPFKSMLAKQHRIEYAIAVRQVDSQAVASCARELVLAPVGMFQFYVFSQVYLDLDPGGPVDVRGRIHTNGDFCVAGQPRIDTVTSAGRILISNPNSHGLCRQRNSASNNIRVATGASFDDFQLLDFDHTAGDWVVQSQARFGTRVMDSAHGIEPLRMPVQGVPRVQSGANVYAMEQTVAATDLRATVPAAIAEEKNQDTLRFLVDPVLTDDPDDIAEQKFAFKADLRILDGVWYLRDPDEPEQPGLPIWSDHPGESTTRYDGFPAELEEYEQVGQESLRGARGWTTTPQRYSYYPFRKTVGLGAFGEQLYVHDRGTTAPPAVVSYGVLHRALDGGVPYWRPGTMSLDDPSTAEVDPSTTLATSTGMWLAGARTGIKNGWLEVRSETVVAPTTGDGASPLEQMRSRLLPLNFDVAAFLAALRACGPGELGSYFPGTCSGAGRAFNGIVWIGLTWPGSLDGLGETEAQSGFAKLWPFHDEEAPAGDGYNQVPPTPLCLGSSDNARLVDAAGDPVPQLRGLYTGTTPSDATEAAAAVGSSAWVRCADIRRDPSTGAWQNAAFPNFVRVINARHISPPADRTVGGITIPADVLPEGLTLATPLPLAVVGDANVDTTPRISRIAPVPADDHFVSFLVATDRFHRHSGAWEDWRANWSEPMMHRGGGGLPNLAMRRQATSTTQHLQILAGWSPTPSAAFGGHEHSSDGFEDFPRYNERWSCATPAATATFFGSIVVGFASVYERSGANTGHGNEDGGYTTCFPNRNEGYDYHLEDPALQPPGTPRLTAQSVSFWKAE